MQSIDSLKIDEIATRPGKILRPYSAKVKKKRHV